MSEKRYIQVILPLRLEWEPCYCLDGADTSVRVQIGDRVRVVFARRSYVGVVSAVDVQPDIAPERIAAVQELLPQLPAVTAREIEFWRFIAGYYLCTIGEVYKASAAGKPQSQVKRPRLKLPEFIARPEVDPELSALAAALSKDKPVLYKAGGRVEEYLSLATGCLAGGRGVLLLVPDKDSAKGLVERFSGYFGGALVEYWSDVTPARRRLAADRVRSGEPYVLLGTRSSLLLPFTSLGLIIVDEEQSPFYKSDAAPRLHARDAAVKLAAIHGVPVVLGSEAPSLESEYNAAAGKYRLYAEPIELKQPLLIDISAEKRKRGMAGCISRMLAAECKKGSVALLRGYETTEEVAASVEQLFPGDAGRFSVFSLSEAARSDLSAYSTVALLNADALFRPDDFRSDERAFQFIAELVSRCCRVIIQTRTPGHQVFSLKDTSALLAERKAFSLPPYTRLVDINLHKGKGERDAVGLSRSLRRAGFNASDALSHFDGGLFVRVTLPRDRSLAAKKQTLSQMAEGIGTPDVDPA